MINGSVVRFHLQVSRIDIPGLVCLTSGISLAEGQTNMSRPAYILCWSRSQACSHAVLTVKGTSSSRGLQSAFYH